jgi:hypothetical protein
MKVKALLDVMLGSFLEGIEFFGGSCRLHQKITRHRTAWNCNFFDL